MSATVPFLLFSLFLTAQVVKPQGLEGQVKAQLDELKALIEGTIGQAVDDLDNLYDEMVSYSITVQEESLQGIDDVYQSLARTLVSLHNQATYSGKDVSSCTSGQDLLFQQLNDHVQERIKNDVERSNMEGTDYLETTKYVVDITINEVGHLEFQLERCGGQILCISPIESEISKNMVRLPQTIRIQVDQVTSSIEHVKVLVKEGSDGNVAGFIADVIPRIQQVVICANKIMARP